MTHGRRLFCLTAVSTTLVVTAACKSTNSGSKLRDFAYHDGTKNILLFQDSNGGVCSATCNGTPSRANCPEAGAVEITMETYNGWVDGLSLNDATKSKLKSGITDSKSALALSGPLLQTLKDLFKSSTTTCDPGLVIGDAGPGTGLVIGDPVSDVSAPVGTGPSVTCVIYGDRQKAMCKENVATSLCTKDHENQIAVFGYGTKALQVDAKTFGNTPCANIPDDLPSTGSMGTGGGASSGITATCVIYGDNQKALCKEGIAPKDCEVDHDSQMANFGMGTTALKVDAKTYALPCASVPNTLQFDNASVTCVIYGDGQVAMCKEGVATSLCTEDHDNQLAVFGFGTTALRVQARRYAASVPCSSVPR